MAARIYQPAKTAMQSGQGNTGEWVLEFEPAAAQTVEPLMGWTSASDMRASQVRLRFASAEAAIAYAGKHGIAYQLYAPRPRKTVIKIYSDNFRFDRTAPWTH